MNLCSESELGQKLVPVVLGGDILAYSYARCFHEAYGVKTMVISGVNVKFTSSSRFTDYRIDPAMGEGDEAIAAMLSVPLRSSASICSRGTALVRPSEHKSSRSPPCSAAWVYSDSSR